MRIIDEDYYIYPEKNGYHRITEKSSSSKNGVIDTAHNMVIEPTFDLCMDQSDNAYWLYDFKSSKRHKDIYDSYDFELIFLTTIENFHLIRHEIFDTYTAYPTLFLYLHKELNKLVLANFDEGRNIVPGNHWYFQKGKYGLMEKDGKEIIEPSFDGIKLNNDGCAIVRKGSEFAVYDNHGKLKIPFTTDKLIYWGVNDYRREKGDHTQQIYLDASKGAGKLEVRCQNCGTEVGQDAAFCSKCGEKLNREINNTRGGTSLPNTLLFTYSMHDGEPRNLRFKTDEYYFEKIKNILFEKIDRDWKPEVLLKIKKKTSYRQYGNQMEFDYFGDTSLFFKFKGRVVYDCFMEFLTENNYKIRLIGQEITNYNTTNNCVADRFAE